MFDNQIIFITGGTGSWGHSLTRRLLKSEVKEIRIYSRNEASQVAMQRDFKDDRIKFIIGDIRDEKHLIEAMKNSDYVFHLAALKHVPICEYQPTEAIATNVDGTNNVIHAAIQNRVKKVIAVSSDKAVNPCNVYGITKALEEKLIIAANGLSDTKFVCVRAGNVMGSAGSVIPLFIHQLEQKEQISITDKQMTRFFILLDEAIDLLIKASTMSFGGEIFVMNMPSLSILSLVQILHKHYGTTPLEINYIGMRPGEKLHEELISTVEMPHCYKLDEKYYLIVPDIMKEELYQKYNNFKQFEKAHLLVYSSDHELLTEVEIEQKLRDGKFI